MQATIFGNNISQFQNTFILFKTYYISKADVQPIPLSYRIVDNKYQWIIDANTEIEDVLEEDVTSSLNNPLHIQFARFEALDKYIPDDEVGKILTFSSYTF